MPIPAAFIPLLAAAGQDGEQTPLNLDGADTAAQAAGSAGGGLVRTIVGLAVVIGVIYGLYWVLKQVKSAREEQSSGSGLDPIATLPLGGSRSLQLVRAGSEILLVGVGEAGVTPIRSYTEREARTLGLLDAAPAEAFGRPGLLERLRDRTVIR